VLDHTSSARIGRGFRRDGGLIATSVLGTVVPLAVWSPESPHLLVAVVATTVGASMYARLAMGRGRTSLQILLAGVALALAGGMPRTVLVSMVTGLFVSELVARVTPRRINFVRVGAAAGGVAAALAATGAGAVAHVSLNQALLEAAAAAAGALLGPGVMLALAPIAEWLYGHVTPMTLTEWLSYDHPLLRDLALHAPGTFQHSVNVGLLADAAARACGANPLVARIGGLYHDVGKLQAPGYFVENQSGDNPHDALDPVSSARIIRAHVTDGVALVRAHHMGRVVADFVREHHGRSVMQYQFRKAVELDARASEDDFRYDGPMPRSRETGIVMIADQIEAQARSAPPDSLARCETIAADTIDRIVASGQLAHANLSDRNLEAIRAALTRAVFAMYHRRLSYPPEPAAEAGKPALGSRLFGGQGGSA
jgi:cyclic-di-AMP phosphodiesterase PgpH